MSDINDFVITALEASIIAAPRDHGLSRDELLEVGKRLGFKQGELNDAIARSQIGNPWGPRLRIQKLTPMPQRLSTNFFWESVPELRDIHSFDFVRGDLQELAREVGEANARRPRDTLVQRGVDRGLKREALELAVTLFVLQGTFEEKDGAVGHAQHALYGPLASQQVQDMSSRTPIDKRMLAAAVPLVRDVIARRTDGRPAAAEPLDAFAEALAELGHERFRAWWVQTRTELRSVDPIQQPVAATVLAASLAEAALSFVVPRAKAAGLMKRIELDNAKGWRFNELVTGAKSGDPNTPSMLDERTVTRCLDLNQARQRIHAGFLIDAVPTGPIPELKPEQPRDALHTTELLVRKVIEWLEAQKGAS